MVLHDVNQAARYAHHMVALVAGRIVAKGTPQQIITPPVLAEVFGVETQVLFDTNTNAPFCIPLKSSGQTPGAVLDGERPCNRPQN